MAENVQSGQVVYEADWDNIVNFQQGEKVLSGAQVTAQASPNLTVKSSAGTIQYGGAIVTVAAVDPITVSAADATNPRVDLVEVDGTTGAVTIKTGTPAATPKPPTLTSGRLLLAFVSVGAAAANIQASNITERRLLGPDAVAAGTLASRPTAAVAGNGGTYFATDDNGGTLYRSNATTWSAVATGVDLQRHDDDGTVSGAVTVNFGSGGVFKEVETGGNVTGFTLSNLPTGVPVYLLVKYGGAHTIAWTTTIKWTAQTTPTATSLNGRYDMFVFVKNVDGDIIGSADLGH